MKQRASHWLTLWLFAAWLALAPSGCWWFGRHSAAVPIEAPVPATRIAKWGVRHIGLVPFADAANRPQVAAHVTQAFQSALMAALGAESVRTAPIGPDLGLIGVGQALKIGRTLDVEGLVTGRVLAYGWQPKLARTWVSVSIRLLEAGRGSIIWSRNATGTTLVTDKATLNAALESATNNAAKEFINDLLASPAQANAGFDVGDRRFGHFRFTRGRDSAHRDRR